MHFDSDSHPPTLSSVLLISVCPTPIVYIYAIPNRLNIYLSLSRSAELVLKQSSLHNEVSIECVFNVLRSFCYILTYLCYFLSTVMTARTYLHLRT